MTWSLVGQIAILWILFVLGLGALIGALPERQPRDRIWAEKDETVYEEAFSDGTLDKFLKEHGES